MFKIIILILFPVAVFSQQTTNADSSTSYKISIDTTLLRDINRSPLEIYVSAYADSINNAINSEMLPKFLKDPDYDYYNTTIWFPGIYTISLRNIIIARVNNCSALNLIINSSNKVYKIKPKKGYRIKFAEFSFFDLALKRFKLLQSGSVSKQVVSVVVQNIWFFQKD